jgi:hypothetical protein
MATPRQLVETVAEVLGVSVATVIVHDRNLSTAPVPLRTVAGRGRAAAKITAVDAANLLIAVSASESVKNSVWTVLTYGGMRLTSRSTSSGLTSTTPTRIRSVDELPYNHTFGEFLAALIDAVAANELRPKEFKATVRFEAPRPSADLEWTFPELREKQKGELKELRGERMGYELKPKTKWSGESGDLFRTTEFSETTILRVGAIIGVSE